MIVLKLFSERFKDAARNLWTMFKRTDRQDGRNGMQTSKNGGKVF